MTTAYVRLTKAAEQQVQTKGDRKQIHGRDVSVIGEERNANAPKGWGGGVHYLYLPVPSPADPDLENFEFPQELIEQVVCNQTVPNAERPQGVYEYEGAKLVAQNYSQTVDDSLGMGSHIRWTQSVTITAPSIAAMQKIYRLFMSRQIRPTEAWDDDGRVIQKVVPKVFTGPKRIICDGNFPNRDMRHYNLTCDVSLESIDSFFVPLAAYNDSKLAKCGELGERLVREIAALPGIGGSIFLHRNQIGIEKGKAFEWSEIEPAILEVLKSAFEGDPLDIEVCGFSHGLNQAPRTIKERLLDIHAEVRPSLPDTNEVFALDEEMDALADDGPDSDAEAGILSGEEQAAKLFEELTPDDEQTEKSDPPVDDYPVTSKHLEPDVSEDEEESAIFGSEDGR